MNCNVVEKGCVSIIVPIYNVERFLDKLILSLIQQTYKNLEIILIDDGSQDNSGSICDCYAKQDNRIKVVHKENGGVSSARNFGLDICSGEYISFIDGDDWVEPDYIEYLLSVMNFANADLAFSDKNFTTRDRTQNTKDFYEVWDREKTVALFLYPGIAIGCWNKIYRRKFLCDHDIRFKMQRSGEGMHFIVTAAQYAKNIGVGHRKIYNYRLNNENSAVTKYNLDMGIYAQKSINAISRELILKTPVVLNAVNWHIWKNYGYIQFLIVATDSLKKNRNLFDRCRKYMLLKLPSVLIKSKVSLKIKLFMVLQTFFPISWAKFQIKASQDALKKDVML